MAMDVPSPAMRRVLRQARLYGYLQARDGRLFHPGGNKPLCRVEMAEEMVRAVARELRFSIYATGGLPTLRQLC